MKKLTGIFFLVFPFLALACQQPVRQDKKSDGNQLTHQQTQNDEQAFYQVLKTFKKDIAGKNFPALAKVMHFPFYTAQQQLPNGITGTVADPVSLKEFPAYQKDIYHAEVLKLVPKAGDDNLSEIDNKTDEPYYLSVKKLTDKGSKLYELYVQYPESGNQGDSFFAFVFGRVNGQYKAIAYYAKWPVK